MKKNLVILFIVIVLGVLSGKEIYNKINDVYALNNRNDNYVYLLQLGVYKNKDSMQHDTADINNKLVLKENNNYYVYVGVSRNKDNLKKISSIYNKMGYNLYYYEKEIDSEEFLENLEQFDLLLLNAKSDFEVESINSVILSSYEEMVLKNKNP